MNIKNISFIYIFTFLWIILFVVYISLEETFIQEEELNYTETIKKELLLLTKNQNFSANNSDLTAIKALQKDSIFCALLFENKIKTITANKDINQIIQKYPLQFFKNIQSYLYISKIQNPINGYFAIKIPKNKKISLLVFVKDKYKLSKQEFILHFMKIIMGIIFLIIAYISYKEYKNNISLINSLNQKVQNQLKEKMEIIYKDTLTSTYKRIKFEIDKQEKIGQWAVMLNIKNFSKINEFYSFKIGDKILQLCAKRIQKLIQAPLYRINADEFVFFTQTPEDNIWLIKNNFITYPIKIEEKNITIRISFRFAITKNYGDGTLRRLSIALKEAKKLPFEDFVYYQDKVAINDDFFKFNDLLYDAIFYQKKANIVPYFQGIKNNKTKQITKYESLIRLKTKQEVYSPYFFLETAKSSGFFYEITKIMIDKTFAYFSKKAEEISFSINITEDDLLTHHLPKYLMDKSIEYDIHPSRVVLEVLEGITSTGAKNNITQLKELKKKGFKIAIDDFGVEYSNFERISELDIDFIKIDGKYIKNINTNQKNYKIAKAITDFAHSMGIKVIAEFVENEQIQKIVESLGIEYSQGYLFSKPNEEI
jgi:EAL domain-containing protein (putative c-di-GMP-specific phosphodiesterase class I)/GGDEF domain-containing protein